MKICAPAKKTLDEVKNWFKAKKNEKFSRITPQTPKGKAVQLPAEQLFAEQDNAPPPPPDQADRDRFADIKARQAIVDQEQVEVVNEAIHQASRIVLTGPDDAHEFLKRTLDSVRTNPDISDQIRRRSERSAGQRGSESGHSSGPWSSAIKMKRFVYWPTPTPGQRCRPRNAWNKIVSANVCASITT